MHIIKSISIVIIRYLIEISSSFAFRISLRKKLGLAFFENPAGIFFLHEGHYCLWDLEGHTSLGNLPYNFENGFRLNAHRGCVRLEYNGQQKLFLPWSIFLINGRNHVVIPHRQNSTKNPNKFRIFRPAITLSILLVMLLIGGVLSQNLSAGTPQKRDISENLSSAADAHLKNTTDETDSTNSPNPDSIAAQRAAQSIRQVRNPSTDILKHEPTAAKKHKTEDRPIDPLRCQPIIQKHKSMMMNRLAQQVESEGSWYVCR